MKNFDFLLRTPIAHRGLHGEGIPENSLSAFAAAIEHGYSIETDIRFSKDDRLVVFHDDNLARLTGDERDAIECSVTELKHLRLRNTDEQIPLLSELLKFVNGRVPLLIEMKEMEGVKAAKIASALAKALENYKGEFAVQSFNPFYIKAFKKLRPDVPSGLLGTAGKGPKNNLHAYVVKNMPFNFMVKPDFVSYQRESFRRKRVLHFKGPKLSWIITSAEAEADIRQCADNIIFEGYLPVIPE